MRSFYVCTSRWKGRGIELVWHEHSVAGPCLESLLVSTYRICRDKAHARRTNFCPCASFRIHHLYFYQPQQSCTKVIFLHACVILSTGVVCTITCWDIPPPPGADPPGSRHPPPGAGTPTTPLGPGAATPLGYSQWAANTHPTGMHSCPCKCFTIFQVEQTRK